MSLSCHVSVLDQSLDFHARSFGFLSLMRTERWLELPHFSNVTISKSCSRPLLRRPQTPSNRQKTPYARQEPSKPLPVRRREPSSGAGNGVGGGSTGASIDGSGNTGSISTGGTYPTSSSPSGGADAGEDRHAGNALWPSAGGGSVGEGGAGRRRRRRTVPPGVTVTDVIPTRLRYDVATAATAAADAVVDVVVVVVAVVVSVVVIAVVLVVVVVIVACPRRCCSCRSYVLRRGP